MCCHASTSHFPLALNCSIVAWIWCIIQTILIKVQTSCVQLQNKLNILIGHGCWCTKSYLYSNNTSSFGMQNRVNDTLEITYADHRVRTNQLCVPKYYQKKPWTCSEKIIRNRMTLKYITYTKKIVTFERPTTIQKWYRKQNVKTYSDNYYQSFVLTLWILSTSSSWETTVVESERFVEFFIYLCDYTPSSVFTWNFRAE